MNDHVHLFFGQFEFEFKCEPMLLKQPCLPIETISEKCQSKLRKSEYDCPPETPDLVPLKKIWSKLDKEVGKFLLDIKYKHF